MPKGSLAVDVMSTPTLVSYLSTQLMVLEHETFFSGRQSLSYTTAVRARKAAIELKTRLCQGKLFDDTLLVAVS